MSLIETLQNKTKEEALQEVFVGLSRRALSVLTEMKTEHLAEGVRKISEYSVGRHKATVNKDSDLSEYKVKFYKDGKHHGPSDYFTDDKKDATDTAKGQCDKNHAKD